MGMSDFNRNNPFVILMRDKSDELNLYFVKTIKFIIYEIILTIISVVSLYFVTRTINTLLIIFLILSNIINIFLFYNSIHHSKNYEINQMVYGNGYKNINVNNEAILDIIEKINYMIGKVEFIIEKILWDMLIILAMIIYIFLNHFLFW